MELITFFDGGKQADSAEYDVVTLAAVSGTPTEWAAFEGEWTVALRNHRAEYLHTTDLVTRNSCYEGWTTNQVTHLLQDCVNVIEKHIAQKPRGSKPFSLGIFPCTTTFVLEAFNNARRSDDHARTAEEQLIRQATGACAKWAEIRGADTHEFIFDRGEPYRGFVCNLIESKKALGDAPWLKSVKRNENGSSRDTPGLQLADLYAWAVSNQKRPQISPWHAQLLGMTRLDQWFDLTNIHEVIPGSQEIWNSWKLPTRKLKR
jgi:hypothetical protein